ncbi:phosphotransferase [Asanoa hainanensis]|uniref:phosphotransferase n=1 Tax=Asanoa hainanensis TaxID=560556 RepID=UPI0015C66DC0|nr:phosphotransferase [Asanoa hainanensis]
MLSTEVTAMVTARYGLGEVLGPPVYAARGELGRIWRLDTTRGAWAVKEALVPVAEADAAADVAFQLAAAAAGVPLPSPVHTTDGRVTVRGPGAVLRVYEWVDLEAGAPTAQELGALLARLHRVAHPARGPVAPWFADPLGVSAWHELAASAVGAPWGAALATHLPELITLDALVRPPDPARVTTCHRDFHGENVRRTASGPLVVLDWENSGPAQPERELAGLLWDLGAGAAEAAAAYGDITLRPEDFSMAIVVQAHLLQFYGRRALDEAESEENRSRAEARLATMLARPLTPAAVDALLE